MFRTAISHLRDRLDAIEERQEVLVGLVDQFQKKITVWDEEFTAYDVSRFRWEESLQLADECSHGKPMLSHRYKSGSISSPRSTRSPVVPNREQKQKSRGPQVLICPRQ
jgi:hypothetical protein